jgi:hypothetical protein
VQNSNKKGGRLRATLQKSGFIFRQHTPVSGPKQAKEGRGRFLKKAAQKLFRL